MKYLIVILLIVGVFFLVFFSNKNKESVVENEPLPEIMNDENFAGSPPLPVEL